MTGRKPKLSRLEVEWLRSLRERGYTADECGWWANLNRSNVLRYLRGECRHHG